MNETLTELKQVLNDDALVRPPTASISIKTLMDKNILIEKISNDSQESIALLEKYLEKNKHSIIALYMLIILQCKQKLDFQKNADNLIRLFEQVGKTSNVVFLAREILKHVESLYALNILITHANLDQNVEEQLDIYERVLKQDITNYRLCIKIAKIKEKLGLSHEATRYYKMAFYHNLENKNQGAILPIWENLIHLNADDIDFFLDNGKKLLTFLDEEKKKQIFVKLFNHYSQDQSKHLKICLTLIKEMISLDIGNQDYRGKIITIYREMYKNHSQLNEIISFTGLSKPWKEVIKQIELFEKLIQFDVGAYVYHKSFGYGLIKKIEMPVTQKKESIQTTKLFIDFKSKENHLMTLRIALNSLTVCHSEDINALNLFDPEKLNALRQKEEKEILNSLFQTVGKPISSSEIKKILVPLIYGQNEWTSTWKKLKKAITQSDLFEVKNRLYGFRTSSKSYKEELIEQFNSSKEALAKLKIVDLFLLNFGIEDESFGGIKESLLKMLKEGKEKKFIIVYLKYFEHHYRFRLDIDIDKEFAKNIDVGGIIAIFEELPNALKHTFIDLTLAAFGKGNKNVINELFFSSNTYAKHHLLYRLQESGDFDFLNSLIANVFQKIGEKSDHFLTLTRHILHNNSDKLSYNKDELFEHLIDLLDESYKDLSFSKENTQAKKIFHHAHVLLFDESHLFNFLRQERSPKIKKNIIDKLNKMHFLDNYIKVEIKEIMTK